MKKFLIVCGVFVFAFAILSVSILTSSAIVYPQVGPIIQGNGPKSDASEINYQFPTAGLVLPDSPFWPLKALRDRVWYIISPSPLKKAELALLFSDKRLVSVQTLLKEGKATIAISTLTKGEKYLEVAVAEEKIARSQSYDTSTFLTKLATASLKHREVIEGLLPTVPEQGKPVVKAIENYSENSFKASRDALYSKGMPVPIDPFDGD
jgi:hypothetical protein